MAALTLLVLRECGKNNEPGWIVTSYHQYAGDNERDT